MKIKMISSTDLGGGAGIASFRLHQCLLKNNIQTKLLVKTKTSQCSTVICDGKIITRILGIIKSQCSQLIVKYFAEKSNSLQSLNIFGSLVSTELDKDDCDIVNIHWINHETLSIKQIGKITKPVVMSLHDMWAFCGVEHYVDDHKNSNFRVGYSSSDHSLLNMNRFIWERKRRNWSNKNITIVTPSHWLSLCAKESLLFNNFRVETIPNALDTNIFKPVDKITARKILNLPTDKTIIGFGAIGGSSDKRKGFDLLLEALRLISPNDSIECAVFGQSEGDKITDDLALNFRFLGQFKDLYSLVLFYNAIDVMVVPSRQEAFGQTASESLSCSTPVVAFDHTGLKDVVDHKVNGYLAEPFCSKDLVCGIEYCCSDKYSSSLRHNARRKALSTWSYNSVGKQYTKLFKEIL